MGTDILFDDSESLRARLEGLGYRIVSEGEIQGGYQFRCSNGSIATIYSSGATLAQGKEAPVLARLLSKECGDPNLHARNRVFVVHADMEDVADEISESLAECFGVEAIVADAGSFADGSFEQLQRQHRRFAQFAVVVARRTDLLGEEVLEEAFQVLQNMFGRTSIAVVADEPVKSRELGLSYLIPVLSLDSLNLYDVIAGIAKQMERTVDQGLRSLMESHVESHRKRWWDLRPHGHAGNQDGPGEDGESGGGDSSSPFDAHGQ